LWINHRRSRAVVHKQRRTRLLHALAKIALWVRLDYQSKVKAVVMAQRRNQRVRSNRFASYFNAAQGRSADGGAGNVHDEALALQQTKTPPEKIRTQRYAEPSPK
jgi:hypothetical protein